MRMQLERHTHYSWRKFVWAEKNFRRMDGRPVHCFLLISAPPLIRSPRMTRWHRPRRGYFHTNVGRSFETWCNYSISDQRGKKSGRGPQLIFADQLEAHDLPVCGTCEGRATGAGHAPTAVELLGELIYEAERGCQTPTRAVSDIPERRTGKAA